MCAVALTLAVAEVVVEAADGGAFGVLLMPGLDLLSARDGRLVAVFVPVEEELALGVLLLAANDAPPKEGRDVCLVVGAGDGVGAIDMRFVVGGGAML